MWLTWDTSWLIWNTSDTWWGWTTQWDYSTIDLIVKIWDTYIDSFYWLNIKENINSVWICELKIPIIPWIKKYDNIEIYEISSWDELLFRWFVNNIEADLEFMDISSKAYKNLLHNTNVLSDKSYTAKSVNFIINDLLTDWNTETWTTYEVLWWTTWSIDKDFKIWDNLYNILDEITWLDWLVWDFKDNKITVWDFLWEDRTDINNYFELFYSPEESNTSNIIKIKSSNQSEQYNLIIWSDWTTKVILKSATDYPYIGKYISFREWDLTTQTQEYLDSRKEEQKILNIETNTKENLNIWDKVKVIIEDTNEYLNFDWDALIISKDIKLQNWSKIVNYWVSSIHVRQDDFIWKLIQMQDNLALQSL